MRVNLVHMSALDDPRIDPFRTVADPELVRRQGRFVAEGRRVVTALLSGGRFVVERVLLSEVALRSLSPVIATLADDVEVVVVGGPSELREITGYRFHQGCLALARLPAPYGGDDLPAFRRAGPWVAVGLEGVTNPDNVGTIFRSADAFGAVGIALSPACAHPLYRKALRTSMGTALTLPFAVADPWPEALVRLQASGIRVLALTPASDAQDLDEGLTALEATDRVLLLVGSEERGLDARTQQAADRRVKIPMTAGTDSLNVAASAAIALQRAHTLLEGPGS